MKILPLLLAALACPLLPACSGLKKAGSVTGSALSGTASMVGTAAGAVGGAAGKVGELNPWDGSDDHFVEMSLFFDGEGHLLYLQLRPDLAPETVANFKELVKEEFYEGLAFHRVIPGFLVQAGDPQSESDASRAAWGLQGPGYVLDAELSEERFVAGTVAMARRNNKVNPEKKSNGSQFFIALKRQSRLDGQYTVFAEVVGDRGVLEQMAQVPTDENDIPLRRVEIVEMKLVHELKNLPGRTEKIAPRSERGEERGELEAEVTEESQGFFRGLLNRVW
ncbi:MAG: peptidylprolyl isomerase [Verrucomicrobiota bacterium]